MSVTIVHPSTAVKLYYNIPLDNSYRNTLYFADQAAQSAWFASKAGITKTDYTVVRHQNSLKVQGLYKQLAGYNYLSFTNPWPDDGVYRQELTYYCFITDVKYVNEGTVEIFYEVDVMQTYAFRYTLMQSFVERNHVKDDTVGLHTLDEGLELGEYTNACEATIPVLNELCVLVLASINPNYYNTTTPVQALAGDYNGVYSGLKVWAVNPLQFTNLTTYLDKLNEAGFLDGIVNLWMYPKALVTLGGEAEWDSGDVFKPVESCDGNFITNGINDYRFTNWLGNIYHTNYVPKNKKLLTYPYACLYVTNNQGDSAVYRFERFNQEETPDYLHMPVFAICGGISPESGLKIVPVNYNGCGFNFDEGIALGNYPTCAWDNDIYKMWLAQNQHQQTAATASAGIQAIAGGAAGIASIFTGNIAGMAAGAATAFSGLNQINQQIAQKKDMAIQPPQAKGHFSASVNVGAGKQNFTFIRKTIMPETAAIIDDFFSMYGYKISRVMIPETACRENYCYVKTIGCNILSRFCNEHSAKIRAIFDNGITFWKDPSKVGDYSVSNKPV